MFPNLCSLRIEEKAWIENGVPKATLCDIDHLAKRFPTVQKWDIAFNFSTLILRTAASLSHITHLTLRATACYSGTIDLRSLDQFHNLIYLKIINSSKSSPLLLPLVPSVREYVYESCDDNLYWKDEKSSSSSNNNNNNNSNSGGGGGDQPAFPNLETFRYTCTSHFLDTLPDFWIKLPRLLPLL